MFTFRFWTIAGGLMLLAVLLAGCSLLLRNDEQQDAGVEELASANRWVIAAQGQDQPAACQQDLSRQEARQEAKETLKEEADALAGPGVRGEHGRRG